MDLEPTYQQLRDALKIPDGRDYNPKNNNTNRLESIMRHQAINQLLVSRGVVYRKPGTRGKWDRKG